MHGMAEAADRQFNDHYAMIGQLVEVINELQDRLSALEQKKDFDQQFREAELRHHLDALGIDIIEAGFPSSNPKDIELFALLEKETFQHTQICAFGMTRRRGIAAKDDPGMKALVDSQAPVVTIVGKTSDFHVTEILRVALDENIDMIRDTVSYLKSQGREVFYDAEHFFDGFQANPQYALSTIRTAAELVLGDNTIKTHVAAIYAKLGVTNRAMAVALYMQTTMDQR